MAESQLAEWAAQRGVTLSATPGLQPSIADPPTASTARFGFHIDCEVILSAEDIWPDGDGPDFPTVNDVEALVQDAGGPWEVIRDWHLMDELDFQIYEVKPSGERTR